MTNSVALTGIRMKLNLNITRRYEGDVEYDQRETHLLVIYHIVRTQSCRQR